MSKTLNTSLNEKEKREIEKDAGEYTKKVISSIPGNVDEETESKIYDALKLGLTELKKENKEKYNPLKNK